MSSPAQPPPAQAAPPLDNRWPMATSGLIALCAAVFLVQVAVPETLWIRDQCSFAPEPPDVSPLSEQFYLPPECSILGPWRFVVSAFFHAGILHLAVNMFALWVAGSLLEQVLGRWRVLAVFVLSALGASVVVDLLPESYWTAGQVGASAGVMGLFGASFYFGHRPGLSALGVSQPGVGGVIFTLFAIASFVWGSVPWQGHLGGLFLGLLLGGIYSAGRALRMAKLDAVGTVVIFTSLVAICLWYHGVTPAEWWDVLLRGGCVERAEVWTCYG